MKPCAQLFCASSKRAFGKVLLCQRKWHSPDLRRSGGPDLLTKQGLSLTAVLLGIFQSVSFIFLDTA